MKRQEEKHAPVFHLRIRFFKILFVIFVVVEVFYNRDLKNKMWELDRWLWGWLKAHMNGMCVEKKINKLGVDRSL